ncbi:MAG: acyl-CoA thioesterase [Saprospirales bacterium]|nr:acyl-CoA thioesterase [Saprospirales bacterium]
MKPKKVAESQTVMSEIVMPNDTNPLHNLMGGNLMRWMDIAAGICAGKHCENYVVTASVDHVSFQRPIPLGDVVTINASVTRAFNTSVEVYVEVFADDLKGGNARRCNHAYLTFVAVDKVTMKPCPVPPVLPLSNDEQNQFESAKRRREMRLILSGRMKPSDAPDLRSLFLGEENKKSE